MYLMLLGPVNYIDFHLYLFVCKSTVFNLKLTYLVYCLMLTEHEWGIF